MPPTAPFEAPSLEGLRVTVPPPRTVRKEDVVARIELLRREHGTVKVLSRGEAAAMGDEVVVDSVGFSDGKVLAFGVEANRKLDLVKDPELPGFAEGIAGMAVGSTRKIHLKLPASWPDAPLRLAPAEFDVELKAARRITRARVTDPAFLQKLGGASLDEVGQKVGLQLQQEWRQEAEARAAREIMTKLAARVSYRVPQDDIDEEIAARWQEAEGKLLQQRKVHESLRKKALEAWQGRARLREEVAQQLKETLVLEAIAQSEGVEVSPARLLEEAGPVLAQLGLDAQKAKQQMEKDARFRAQLMEKVRRHKTVELVMSRAKAKVSDNLWGI
ncbi:MAG TPA: FKBP-type peptidyl-prolyl cis-trans isomerase [Myxococcales bacterium]|nr:FKBP-type peptidyl-prolyl cis-trans isomerase [Myxococcales bacterium]